MTEVIPQNRSITELFTDPSLGGRRQTFEAGQVILDRESPSADVWFVHRGQVRIYQPGPDGSQRMISILGAEQWFNCVALAGEAVSGFKAVATTQTVVTAVPVTRLVPALLRNPEAATEMLRQMAQRLLASYDAAAQLVFNDCHSRLIKTLCQLSTSACATPVPDGGVVLRITHAQLAQAVGAARETISLALTDLRRDNVLQTGRNRLLFDPKALQQWATRRPTKNTNANNASAPVAVPAGIGSEAEYRQPQVA